MQINSYILLTFLLLFSVILLIKREMKKRKKKKFNMENYDIEECLVNYEVAKWAKEKRFDGKC